MAQETTTKTDLTSQINDLLNEEKWTRAALNNYTVNNFKELDQTLEQIFGSGLEDEILETCEEHLHHTKNSIIALYISGVIRLRRQLVDDSNLVMIINIFQDNHKWKIVEYLAKRILEFGENKYALRTLADCYNNENMQEEMYEIWERLIRVDFEEADIVRHLGERYEKEGNIEEAVSYYKKAIHRYINKKSFNNVREIWHKLVTHAPDETEFFYHAENKVAKTISEDRAVQLLEELFPQYKKKEAWDTAIDILKRVLTHDPKNPWARKEIIDCFRERYAHHSHLEEYIKISNLNQSWRNVHDAIADFEKHISFDAGNFVFHRTWGVGIIKSIDDDNIVIDFAKKRGHNMSLKMAVSALDILPKDHIWVLRSISKRERLHAKVKNDIKWALKTVIRSCGNAADMKRIKAELVPHILSQSEWSSWSTKARHILKTNQEFGNKTDKLDHFVVRDQPISFEEKTFNKFKAEKTFFDRVKTLSEYVNYIEQQDGESTDTDYFREMLEYFVGYLRSHSSANEYVVSSFIVVRRVIERHPYLNPGIELDFLKIFRNIPNLEETFLHIENVDLRREFLHYVRHNVPEWPEIYIRLFPYHLAREIVVELERAGEQERLQSFFLKVLHNYKEMRDAFVWIVRNCLEDEWAQELAVDHEKVLIGMIHLLDITAREIDNRRDVSQNRKLNKQIHNYLFKERNVDPYIEEADEEAVNRIYTLISDVKDLDPSIVIELKHKILNRFPNFRFYGENEKERVSRGFLVSQSAYEKKQAQLQHINDVEVPKNSQEISEALQHGDLRENAEYKAAKEKQDMLNNQVAKLKDETDRAQIMRKSDVDSSVISFGTRARLRNNDTGEIEVYTVLGPWESNPDERIISYLSPLGSELYNRKVGEEMEFDINEHIYRYTVESIEVADF